jgi:hypothetical protein
MGSGSAPNSEVIAIIEAAPEPDPAIFRYEGFGNFMKSCPVDGSISAQELWPALNSFYRRNPPRAALMETPASAGMPLPDSFEELETFTSFGACIDTWISILHPRWTVSGHGRRSK